MAATGGRRGHGEGSVYQRRDGRWVACISAGWDEHGKRQRWTGYRKSKREAQALLRRMRAEADAGLSPARGDVTVEALIQQWLENVVRPNLRPLTVESYEKITRLHILPALGKVRIRDLDPPRVQALLSGLQKNMASGSVFLVRSILRRAHSRRK